MLEVLFYLCSSNFLQCLQSCQCYGPEWILNMVSGISFLPDSFWIRLSVGAGHIIMVCLLLMPLQGAGGKFPCKLLLTALYGAKFLLEFYGPAGCIVVVGCVYYTVVWFATVVFCDNLYIQI